MAKKIRVWDGTAWQDVAPSLPYTAIHSAQASMPLTGVDGQVWLDTDGTLAGQDFVPLSGGTMTGNLNVPSINSGPIVGRNKFLNGDFSIWQRGTSFNGTGYFYTADRWLSYGYALNSGTVTRESFTVGSAPVAGYEGQYFLRASSTNSQTWIGQRLEDIRLFAGQTVTVSFWAKSSSGTPVIGVNWFQNFGSGGSSGVVTSFPSKTISTSWERYSTTVFIPAINGKTIGTNSYVELALFSGTININIDYWGVQLEAGNQATPFHTATPNQQTELAACQRYFIRYMPNSTIGNTMYFASGNAISTTRAMVSIPLPTSLRATPSFTKTSGVALFNQGSNYYLNSIAPFSGVYQISQNIVNLDAFVPSGLTNNTSVMISLVNTSDYIEFSAEL